MKLPLFQIDAFTDRLFGGNPAGVCPLQNWLDSDTMQHIAAENNLAETAFFVPQEKTGCFEIRWFTPKTEVNLCGHATLASAFVIFNVLKVEVNALSFQSRSGELRVTRDNELLTLDFPAAETYPFNTDIRDKSGIIVGVPPSSVFHCPKLNKLLLLFDREEDIISLNPKFGELSSLLESFGSMGMIVTAPGKQSDFVSRFFAPPVGIDEDPVTGSAHTVLTPFWAQRLNKTKLHAFQLSKRRGELFCELAGDRVLISGKAVAYLKGEIEI